MKLFEQICKKYEENLFAKAQKKEEEKQRREQARQNYIEELLNSTVEEQFLLELSCDFYNTKGKYTYSTYDYFISDTNRNELKYGDKFTVTKISGGNIGGKFTATVGKMSSLSMARAISNIKAYVDGAKLQGFTEDVSYIPAKFKTEEGFSVRELNNYANQQNNKRREDYAQNKLKMQQLEQEHQDKFFR